MRIRIALTAAMAATGITTSVFTFSASSRADPVRATTQRPADTLRTTTLSDPSLARFVLPATVPAEEQPVPEDSAPVNLAGPVAFVIANAATAKVAKEVVSGTAPFNTAALAKHFEARRVVPVVPPVTAPAAPPVATPAAPVPVTDANSVNTPAWACIRLHESGNRYNSPAAPSGAYGILLSTWRSFGHSGWPYQATPSVQDQLALKLYSLYGFHPWSSRFACGL